MYLTAPGVSQEIAAKQLSITFEPYIFMETTGVSTDNYVFASTMTEQD